MSETFFISDLHLHLEDPQTLEIFLQFLQHRALKADALYILGDLFEAWIGDDDLSPFNLQVMQAINQAVRSGLPVYFMRGNRDFLIGKRFAKKTGVKLLADPHLIELYGVRTLLMHGDSLCTFDIKHQKARRFTLNPLCQWLALQLPLPLRRRAAVWLRSKSRSHHHSGEDYIMDVSPATVDEVMNAHQASRLIHGHTHRPAFHATLMGERIVLGAWHETGSLLVCNQQGCQLQTL